MKIHKKPPVHFLYVFIIFCFSISLLFPRLSAAYGFYNWYRQATGYELAMMDAVDFGKPLVVYFYLEQDKWSEKMSNEYIADTQVDEFLLDIPKAAIDFKYGDQEQRLAEELGIDSCPAFLISIPSLEAKFQRIHPFSEKGEISIDQFLEAIKKYITHHYNIKAHSLFEEKEYEKSLELFEKSIEIDPENSYTYHAIGVVYHIMGVDSNDSDILKKAEESYKKALELEPDNEDIKVELEKLMKDQKKAE